LGGLRSHTVEPAPAPSRHQSPRLDAGLLDDFAVERDLGDKHCLIMWNHGLLTIGRTIAEAFLYMRRLVDACELQIQLMSMGTEIRHIPQDVLETTSKQIIEKRKSPRYAQVEWDYHCRLAERFDPGFAE
jgi:ribulose-5-phosphate 4-epimerase/fuculose-1-phosphate aldolase